MVLVSVMAIIAFDADDKDAIPVSAVEGTNDDDGATAVGVVGDEECPDNDGGLVVRGSETMLFDRCSLCHLFLSDSPAIPVFGVVAVGKVIPPVRALAEVLRRCRGKNMYDEKGGDVDEDDDVDVFTLDPVVVPIVAVVAAAADPGTVGALLEIASAVVVDE